MIKIKDLFCLFVFLVSFSLSANEAALNEEELSCYKSGTEKCYDLARQYHKKAKSEKDSLKAKKLISKANKLYENGCTKGSAKACGGLGYSYEVGRGLNKDLIKANELYENACDSGAMFACRNLGHNYKNGNGLTKNFRGCLSYLGQPLN